MRLFRGLFLMLAAQALLIVAVQAGLLVWGLNFGFARYLAARHVPATPISGAELDFLRGQIIVIGAVLVAVLVIMLLAGLVIARSWARPQRALFEASTAVAEGNYTTPFPETGPLETIYTMRNLGRIARSFDRLETARRTWLVAIAEEMHKPVDSLDAYRKQALAAGTPVPEHASDHVQRLIEITADLQAVALADLGRLPVNFTTVDPCALIHNAIWMNKRRAELARVSLESGELPATTVLVKWDGGRIEQLFTALIENSLRYTPPGGRIVLGLEGRKNAWRLLIDDSAPGVDIDLAQRLFEPFYRTTTLPGESVTSSGLGLATAQAIVEAHHGRIEAGASPIGGLRVQVVLPAMPPTA